MGHLSAYITSHLDTQGMSRAEFSRKVGIAKSSATAILDGASIPEERTLRKIADALPGLSLTELRENALRDTPFELPEGSELLDLDERNHVKATVRQLLKSSGKDQRVGQPSPAKIEDLRRLAAGNVVEMPSRERVKKAAYNPPNEE